MNIASLLSRAGNVYQDKPAVFFADQLCVTYQQLAQRCAVIANNLVSKYRLQPGDRVAITSSNCPEYVELYFAIWHAGLVAVPVNAKLHVSDFHYVIAHSGARLCFTSEKLVKDISPLVAGIESFDQAITIGGREYLDLYQGEAMPLFPREPKDPAWLFYTSGTTGKPKGAMQSHQNLMAMTQCYFSDVNDIGPGDVLVHAAPMSHGGGYYILPHIAKGGVNVIPASGGFNEQELLELLAVHRQVSLFAAPTMVKRWVEYALAKFDNPKHKFDNLKAIIYGGGPMYQNDLAKAQALLGNKLVQIYGQGECPMSITVLNKFLHQDTEHAEHSRRLASVGVAMTGVAIKIADEQGKPVPPGQAGEILVKSDAVMLGYFNNPQATDETIVDGWLKTGDMARLSEDGFVTLVDRSKDVIISGGTNIYPREIEEVLNQHSEIRESSVIGKKHSDWGEIVIAVLVLEPDSQLDIAGIDKYCLDNMARFKRPKEYVFVSHLPKNNTGKILKTELRQQLA